MEKFSFLSSITHLYNQYDSITQLRIVVAKGRLKITDSKGLVTTTEDRTFKLFVSSATNEWIFYEWYNCVITYSIIINRYTEKDLPIEKTLLLKYLMDHYKHQNWAEPQFTRSR